MEFKKIVYPAWACSRAPPGVYNRHNALMGRSQSARLSSRTVLGCGWLANSLTGPLSHKHPPKKSGASPRTITVLSVPLHKPTFHPYPAVTSMCSPIMEAVLLMGSNS